MNIVGVVGLIGSGKNTIGDILESKYDYTKMSFADSLKNAVSVIFGWPRHLLEGDTLESRVFREQEDRYWSEKMDRPISPRIVLQQVGTECMRNTFGSDIWIASLEKKITDSNIENIVITDVRFPNEIASIRKLGGKVIRVKRGPDPNWFDYARSDNSYSTHLMTTHFPEIHNSEWAWIGSKFDYTIENDFDLKHLDKCIEGMLSSIIQKNT